MINSIIKHVSSGTFITAKKSQVILQAHLGTCVGIALHDKKAGVGGLFHILLPHPSTESWPESPEKYASTGLPIFLQALYDLGAEPENLEAAIAGGALVGPLRDHDINLDIGGRSTETALAIIEKNKIKISKSETGGFFTCSLELDMNDGIARIKPVWEKKKEAEFIYSSPSSKDIGQTIESLKPIPQAALKILRIFQNESYTIEEISRELHKDQVLAARTLQLCNSAMFKGKIRIHTIKDALLILGEQILIKSIITSAVKAYFNQAGSGGYSLCKGGMFFHSVGCAIIAEKIASMTRKADPKLAYTAGLLHDIGKVVLDQYISQVCPMFFRGLNCRSQTCLEIEKKILGMTHCDAGKILAQKWDFSDPLIEVITHHHHPENALKHKELACIIFIADLLISKFNAGLELEKIQADNLSSILSFINLTIPDIPSIIDAIPLHIFNLQQESDF